MSRPIVKRRGEARMVGREAAVQLKVFGDLIGRVDFETIAFAGRASDIHADIRVDDRLRPLPQVIQCKSQSEFLVKCGGAQTQFFSPLRCEQWSRGNPQNKVS